MTRFVGCRCTNKDGGASVASGAMQRLDSKYGPFYEYPEPSPLPHPTPAGEVGFVMFASLPSSRDFRMSPDDDGCCGLRTVQ